VGLAPVNNIIFYAIMYINSNMSDERVADEPAINTREGNADSDEEEAGVNNIQEDLPAVAPAVSPAAQTAYPTPGPPPDNADAAIPKIVNDIRRKKTPHDTSEVHGHTPFNPILNHRSKRVRRRLTPGHEIPGRDKVREEQRTETAGIPPPPENQIDDIDEEIQDDDGDGSKEDRRKVISNKRAQRPLFRPTMYGFAELPVTTPMLIRTKGCNGWGLPVDELRIFQSKLALPVTRFDTE
jgi:hypothetical protein